MAFYLFGGLLPVAYPTFGFKASPGDIVDFAAVVPPNDGQWSSNAGPANVATIPVGPSSTPLVVAPLDGQIPVWSTGASQYVPGSVPGVAGVYALVAEPIGAAAQATANAAVGLALVFGA